MSIIWAIVVLSVVGFLALIWYTTPKRKPEKKNIKKTKEMLEEGNKLLVRADGSWGGVVYDEKQHTDDNGNTRRRMEIITPEGEEKTEPRDYIQNGQPKKFVTDIEQSGGAVVTQLISRSEDGGSAKRVLTGNQARELNKKADMVDEMNLRIEKMNREHQKTKDRYNEVENRASRLEKQKQELEDKLEDFRETNYQLQQRNERLEQKVKGREAGMRTLLDQIRELEQAEKISREQMKNILQSVGETEEMGVEFGAGAIGTSRMLDQLLEEVESNGARQEQPQKETKVEEVQPEEQE